MVALAIERLAQPFALDSFFRARLRERILERRQKQPFVPRRVDFARTKCVLQQRREARFGGRVELGQLGLGVAFGVLAHASLPPSGSALRRAAIARWSTTSNVATLTPSAAAASSRERSSRMRMRMASA